MLARWEKYFYGASLLTLPWVGLGVLKISTGRDFGGGLQPAWLFLALAILCATTRRFLNRRSGPGQESLLQSHPRRWLLLGFAAILVSVLVSAGGMYWAPSGESPSATWGRFAKQVGQLVIMLAFALWPALWTRGAERWTWTIKLLLIGGALQVGYGLLQGVCYYYPSLAFSGLDAVFTSNPAILSGSDQLYLEDAFHNVPRLRGTVCEPLYLGNFLLFLGPFLLVPVWSARTRGLLAVSFGALLLGTWSRGAWIGLAVQVAVATVVVYRLRSAALRDGGRLNPGRFSRIIWGSALLLAVVPLVGWLTGWDGLLFPFRRLVQSFSSQDWSNLTRLYSMQAAWRGFLLSPVLGLGWGQFGWHFPALVDPLGLQSQFTWPVVNNFPLLILCETGLAGFLVFLAWGGGLVSATRSRIKALKRVSANVQTDVLPGRILLAALTSAVGVGVQLLTFSQYNLPHIWVAFGLLLAILAGDNLTEKGPSGPSVRDNNP